MKMFKVQVSIVLFIVLSNAAIADEPLPSWEDTEPKRAIIAFVQKVTDQASPSYVVPEERIATFDNDGCLWAEQPIYFQALFAIDQIKRLSADHPEWKATEPYKSAIQGDIAGVMSGGKESLAKIVFASHANIDAEEFSESVRRWLATAKHPTSGKLYIEMTYQPMVELLQYLRANHFKTFIVSGGGVDFLRAFAEQAYGIPPQQVVGSSLAAKFEVIDGRPTIIKLGEGLFVDDKEGKPVGIYQHIGRRPIFAAGNSDGDLQMLQYTTLPRTAEDKTPRFGLIVHHTDAKREWAYDRDSEIGKLDKALDQADDNGWIVVDMKDDWNQIFRNPEAGSQD